MTRRVCLLHDDARLHTANVAKQLLDFFGWNFLNSPPHYSPDFAPSDYYLFTSLKMYVSGNKFLMGEETVDK